MAPVLERIEYNFDSIKRAVYSGGEVILDDGTRIYGVQIVNNKEVLLALDRYRHHCFILDNMQVNYPKEASYGRA